LLTEIYGLLVSTHRTINYTNNRNNKQSENKTVDKEMKSHVQFVSDAVEELMARIEKELADMAKARGSTKESIANGIEAILKIFGASKESYHGGDYNGGPICLIVRYAKEIGELILALLWERSTSNVASEECIREKVDGLEHVLGCIDATVSKLAIINPIVEEMLQAQEACNAMMRAWRKQGFRMTLKAHICEDDLWDWNEACGGLGRMDESFVEHISVRFYAQYICRSFDPTVVRTRRSPVLVKYYSFNFNDVWRRAHW
jgi:hypothetical protein